MDFIVAFAFYWGVWLVVPILIDGFTTIVSLAAVLITRARDLRKIDLTLDYHPLVSIIVPVYQSADTLEACIQSIAAQDYPGKRMEVLFIDNGSTDDSFAIFSRLQGQTPLRLHWHSIINRGKAWALNAGIHLTRGEYVFNVDSDVVLDPQAIRRVVETMVSEPDLGAVTGAIEVLPPEGGAHWLHRTLAECEFYEYITAFHVGREQQTLLQNLYTLSGAFTAFRREVLFRTFLYSNETITEDTDLTFELYERVLDKRIGCVSSAIAYVHPIPSVGALYSQRVRWQHGQIEVSARHESLLKGSFWRLSGFSPARVLAIDHTLAFPRLVWTFLLPVLAFFGYSLAMILMAWIVLYAFYLLIDLAWVGVAWLGTNEHARRRLRQIWWLLPVLPLYRMLIFWFRFSGFLQAVAEPGVWRSANPVEQLRQAYAQVHAKGSAFFERPTHPAEKSIKPDY